MAHTPRCQPAARVLEQILAPLASQPYEIPAGSLLNIGGLDREHALVVNVLDTGSVIVSLQYAGQPTTRLGVTGTKVILLTESVESVIIATFQTGQGATVWVEQVQGYQPNREGL